MYFPCFKKAPVKRRRRNEDVVRKLLMVKKQKNPKRRVRKKVARAPQGGEDVVEGVDVLEEEGLQGPRSQNLCHLRGCEDHPGLIRGNESLISESPRCHRGKREPLKRRRRWRKKESKRDSQQKHNEQRDKRKGDRKRSVHSRKRYSRTSKVERALFLDCFLRA